jgi:UDP-glucose 4-epimerase
MVDSSKVVVTGGIGKVGKYVVRELVQHGHEVRVFDVAKPQTERDTVPGVEYHVGDILKIDSCKKNFKSADAIVHLAAIPRPIGYPPEVVFNVNVNGTFNVLQAACDLGVGRIVFTSSDAAYGFNFRNSFEDLYVPDYLPIDEGHPLRPKDVYGLSKKLDEEIAQSLQAKYGTTIIGLRISHVIVPTRFGRVGIEAYRKNMAESGLMIPPYVYDQEGRIVNRIFSYNDVRDAALGFRLAVEEPKLEGKYEIIGIGALDDNSTKFKTKDLLREYQYTKVPLKRELKGREPLIDFGKAKRILGFKSSFNWWKMYCSRDR